MVPVMPYFFRVFFCWRGLISNIHVVVDVCRVLFRGTTYMDPVAQPWPQILRWPSALDGMSKVNERITGPQTPVA